MCASFRRLVDSQVISRSSATWNHPETRHTMAISIREHQIFTMEDYKSSVNITIDDAFALTVTVQPKTASLTADLQFTYSNGGYKIETEVPVIIVNNDGVGLSYGDNPIRYLFSHSLSFLLLCSLIVPSSTYLFSFSLFFSSLDL